MAIAGNRLETIRLQLEKLMDKNPKDPCLSFFINYPENQDLVRKEMFKKRIMNLMYLFDLSKKPIKQSKILDVGCGFGIDCVLLAAMGASEVHGLDTFDLRIKAFKAYIEEMKSNLPIVPQTGDASRLPHPDNYFDVLMSIEAISHYRDVDTFLSEANRVLKKEGALIISDTNNGANPFIRRNTYKIWERFENGPPAKSYYGHPIKKSYRDMREDIIKAQFPKLVEEEGKLLAESTFGMGKDEIFSVCRQYIQTGVLPQSRYRYGVPPLNPVMNDYIERLFIPQKLAQKIRSYGFRVKTFSHFAGAGRRNILGIVNAFLRFLSFITIYAARGYKMVAIKED